MRVVVRQPASQGYFHALHGIHEYKPEFAVKQVQLPRCVQRRAGLKRLPAGASDVLKWVKIGAKPGVAYILETLNENLPVSNQSPADEQISLFFKTEMGMIVMHCRKKTLPMCAVTVINLGPRRGR